MLDSLRYFLAIARHGSFTKAAAVVGLSQPALTASIRRLEESMGTQLFTRTRQGAELTTAGDALVPSARAALSAVDDGRRAVAEIASLAAGEVRLGAGATACTYLLPAVLARYRERHPAIRYLLRETTTEEARVALASGEIDIAITTVEPDQGELWFEDELVLVRAPGLKVSDVETAPFITFRRGSVSRQLFEQHFPRAPVVMELGSIAAVKGNVRAGIGVALVSRHAIVRDRKERSLRVIPHPATPIHRPLYLVHRGVDRLPPAAAALRELLLGPKGQPLGPRSRAARPRP